MGYMKTLAVNLIEYEDEINAQLQIINAVDPAVIKAIFTIGRQHDTIEAYLSAFNRQEANSAKINKVIATAILMDMIDEKTLKIIPLNLTFTFNNFWRISNEKSK